MVMMSSGLPCWVCEPDDVIPSTYEIPGASTELEVVSGMHSDAAMMFRVDG